MTRAATAVETSAARAGIVTGEKLGEAARYLKSARSATLAWVREAAAASVELNAEHMQEVLNIADRLEDIRGRLEAKASLFGVSR